ncbi:formyl transferase domain protein [Fibrisoma limi BUZ 3]|uniref:Formyl transferase domain protein n=1 Tax=Fibrisoma limi BUZ 3 TaxID=1185876 RepID=I2GFV6_9BACT|nr:formyltransferase family protein [Fibrisoma limi]CCH52781.1 formyl transferase domain protein [Fibrisoma limi BUZ 3]
MRLVILTQDDPFYLARNIDYFLKKLPPYAEVVATVVFDVSPFGKRESFTDKMKKTYEIFGLPFFIRYGFKYLRSKLDSRNNVRKVLADRGIPFIEIEGNINKDENLEKIRSYKPDLLVSIAGNQIFKRKLLDVATHGCVNLHTALLPKYRGLMPSFWVLKNGETHTGVSVFFVDEGIDSGPILVQKKVEIGNRSQEQLIKDTKLIGMDAIIESIEKIHSGNYELIANDASQMTYFSFPTREDVRAFQAAGKRFY